MKVKEVQAKLVADMERWKKVETASVTSTSKIFEKTENVVIRAIAEIIQNDSKMHYRIQDLLIQTLTNKTVAMSPEDLSEVWSLVQKHIAIERQTMEIAQACLDAMKGKKMPVQAYLLSYLMADETKHEQLLEDLGKFKKSMYP